MTQGIPAADVQRVLEEVLAREEFRREEPWLVRLLDRLFGDLGLPGFDASAAAVLAALLGVAALVLFLFVLRRLARDASARRSTPTTAERARPDLVRARVAELLEQARAARAHGDLRLALRLFFFALVVGLGRSGALEYRAAWTLRELLARGRPSPEVSALLVPLTAELEGQSFGREPTRAADVERLEELCARFGVEG